MIYQILVILYQSSGVASGWHGWTMSRGPGAKGAPERQREKQGKEEKEKRKEKRKRKKERKEKNEKEKETF